MNEYYTFIYIVREYLLNSYHNYVLNRFLVEKPHRLAEF